MLIVSQFYCQWVLVIDRLKVVNWVQLLQVINISSPNTPGLRKLQGRKQLQDLIKKVKYEVVFVDLTSLI